MLSRVNPERLGVEPKKLIEVVSEKLNLISSNSAAIALVFSSNPFAALFSEIEKAINRASSFADAIQNIQTIEELQAKKAELEGYYKPGGKFDQDLQKISNNTHLIVENYYTSLIAYRRNHQSFGY